MKQYLIWRNGRQAGPFFRAELKQYFLYPDDLVWVEGSSEEWLRADELPETRALLRPRPEADLLPGLAGDEALVPFTIIQPSKKHSHGAVPDFRGHRDATVTGWRRWLHRSYSLQAAAVFVGLLVCTLITKNLIDELVNRTFGLPVVAEARVIAPAEPRADEDFQNALVRSAAPREKELATGIAESAKTVKHQLRIEAKEYTTGYWGRISNLLIRVSNASATFVNQAEVEVAYLSQDGEVLFTETHIVKAIHPHSQQSLRVPSSPPGGERSPHHLTPAFFRLPVFAYFCFTT